MTVSALCAPFKTFLMRQYGEDFVTVMTQEYEGTDITNPNSAAYNTHISVLTGPEQPERPQTTTPITQPRLHNTKYWLQKQSNTLGCKSLT